MISVVIPTLNRSYVLQKTLPSYFCQDLVSEIVVVDDGGSDQTKSVLREVEREFPRVKTQYIRHEKRLGAASARNTGVRYASNSYIMFGDDDAMPCENYVKTLYGKLNSRKDIAGVAGQWVQMLPEETITDACQRFGNGLVNSPPFSTCILLINTEAVLKEDQLIPMMPPVFLCRKDLLLRYPFDESYFAGNGYREESTFQAVAYIDGHNFLMTNEVKCFHFAKECVRSGGQRMTSMFQHYLWCLYHNHRFLKSFYVGYQKRLNIRTPRIISEMTFALTQFYRAVFKPFASIYVKKKILKNLTF